MKKKIALAVLAGALVFSQIPAAPVHGATIDEVKKQKSQTESQYKDAMSQIDELTVKQNEILSQIDDADKELVNTLISIDAIKASLAEKESQITATQAEITQAEADKQKQYDAIKTRIQYLYENGGDGSWLVSLLQEGDLNNLLSSVEQTQELYDYDQKELAKYMEAVQYVKDLDAELEQQKNDMLGTQREQEAQQANLESQLAELKGSSSDYEAQLANAQNTADQFNAILAQQTTQISTMEEQQKQEEAKKRQAEAEAQAAAARQAAESASQAEAAKKADEAAKAEADAQKAAAETAEQNPGTSDNGDSSEPQAVIDDTEAPTETPEEAPTHVSSGDSSLGQSIADFACGYIGQVDYEWGGTDLNTGVDCSGFVNQVFAHFGISVSRQSGDFLGDGSAVSLSEAQPGDIVVYSGHVGLYIGGGQMVNAADYGVGVVISSVSYKPILSIRRVV